MHTQNANDDGTQLRPILCRAVAYPRLQMMRRWHLLLPETLKTAGREREREMSRLSFCRVDVRWFSSRFVLTGLGLWGREGKFRGKFSIHQMVRHPVTSAAVHLFLGVHFTQVNIALATSANIAVHLFFAKAPFSTTCHYSLQAASLVLPQVFHLTNAAHSLILSHEGMCKGGTVVEIWFGR